MTARLSPHDLALPPPLSLNLVDRDRTVGWVRGDAVGFRGFADETEAAHAAWVSYRALARRLAPAHRARPLPIDTEPLALHRRGDVELILASGRPIATLVRPGPESPSGADSFGFEIGIPEPADELRVRAMGHLMYRTLRKSGLRWAMWRPAPERAAAMVAAQPASEHASGSIGSVPNEVTGRESNAPEHLRGRPWRFPLLPWRRARWPGRAGSDRLAGVRRR